MKCSACGNEYTPLTCPTCQNPLEEDGRCPACAVGTHVTCEHCGQTLEIAPAPAEDAPANTPAEQPESPAEPPAAPATPAGPAQAPQQPQQPQQPYGQPQYPQPPYGGQAPQQYPGQFPQPQQPYHGNQPYSQPQYRQPPYGQPQYPMQPGVYGNSPYTPYVMGKVPLGGWFLFYFVLTIIGLCGNGFSILSSAAAIIDEIGYFNYLGSFGTFDLFFSFLVVTALFVLQLLIVINISKRNLNFRKWFYILAVISLVNIAYTLIALLIDDSPIYSLSSIYASLGLNINVIPIFWATYILTSLVSAGLTIAWWVYFNRSRRVAYTCDPANNPPRR